VVGGAIVVAGGRDHPFGGASLDAVELFDPDNGAWHKLPRMHQVMASSSCHLITSAHQFISLRAAHRIIPC
jgi:hypothetical protein